MGSWQQVRGADIGITYTGGWCLKAVQDAFGTPHVYPTAMADWQSGEDGSGGTSLGNHDGQTPPDGVQVPVYLALGNVSAGDVAISLGNGQVAATAQSGTHQGLFIYNSLQAYINDYSHYNGGATYLGWSEGTANTRVVQYQPDITTQDVTSVDVIPFTEETQDDPFLPLGQSQTTQVGVNGSHTVVTRITYSDGTQTAASVISDMTVPPVPHILSNGTAQIPPEPPTEPPVNPTPPIPPKVPTGFWQAIIDFLSWLFKNVIAGVK